MRSAQNALTKVASIAIVVVVVVAAVGGGLYFISSQQVAPTRPAPTQPVAPPTPEPPRPAEPPAKPAPVRVKIGASLPITGPLGALSRDLRVTYQWVVDDYNKDGGIPLREFNKRVPVELSILDSVSDPTKEVSNVERLVNVDGVDFLLGRSARL